MFCAGVKSFLETLGGEAEEKETEEEKKGHVGSIIKYRKEGKQEREEAYFTYRWNGRHEQRWRTVEGERSQ